MMLDVRQKTSSDLVLWGGHLCTKDCYCTGNLIRLPIGGIGHWKTKKKTCTLTQRYHLFFSACLSLLQEIDREHSRMGPASQQTSRQDLYAHRKLPIFISCLLSDTGHHIWSNWGVEWATTNNRFNKREQDKALQHKSLQKYQSPNRTPDEDEPPA